MDAGPMMQEKMTPARWLFNPFVRIAGATSLVGGLVVIGIGGLAAAAAGIRFDGLLDMHSVHSVPVWLPILEGLLNWITISLLFVLIAQFFGGSRRVRLIDITGTQALARAPLLPAAAVCMLPSIRNSLAELPPALQTNDFAAVSSGVLLAGLTMLAGIVWTVVLMWNAFSVSCNIKGGRSIALFIVAVVIGELATKFLILRYL